MKFKFFLETVQLMVDYIIIPEEITVNERNVQFLLPAASILQLEICIKS